MNDTPSRVFALALILIAVWVGTYWLYEPGDPPVTFDAGRPAAAERLLSSSGGGGRTSQPRLIPDHSDASIVGPPAELKPPPDSEPPPPAPLPPPPAPQGPTLVPPEFDEYVVQSGDRSFEDIAQKFYNDRSLWEAVSKANPLVTPDKLIPGRTRLRIARDPKNIQGRIDPGTAPKPDGPTPTPEAPKPASREIEYVIERDDTLWGIAKKFYGRGAAWRVIADANKEAIPDPDKPKAGTKIRIPPPPTEPEPN